MTRPLLFAIVVCAGASFVAAAPIACPTVSTLQTLINLDTSGGCITQDKIFSNFSYDPLGGAVSASDVSTTLVFIPGGTTDIHGWVFAPSTGSWTTGFDIGFTISVASGNPGVSIVGSKDQLNVGFVPSGVVGTDTQSVGTIVTQGLAGMESEQISYAGVQSVDTATSVSIPVGAGNLLASYEQDFQENLAATVPEPMSFLLIGVGLLGLGYLRRRGSVS